MQTVETLTESNNELNGEIGILYVPCPEGGKHTMTSHAAGELYKDGKFIIKDGFAWQCSKCLDVIVSQYNPKWVKKLGKYGRMNPGFRLETFYIMKYPTTVGTASSTTVEPWISSYVWY
ncbi:hypothetical protein A499_15806 [Niallia nealsonii AAU1]|nr:hypothetical protein A499_15806 [Niallia nealsonii AAU1]